MSTIDPPTAIPIIWLVERLGTGGTVGGVISGLTATVKPAVE